MDKHKQDIFLRRINKSGKYLPDMSECCWEFMPQNRNFRGGRSTVSFSLGNGRAQGINVCAYNIFVGEVPAGRMVLRKCHNYLCVRPEHLYLGGQGNAKNVEKTVDGILYKKCPHCKNWYPKTVEFFYEDRLNNIRSHCKSCANIKAIESRKNNWARQLLYEATRDRKNRHIECTLTLDDINFLYNSQKGRCYWTGITLEPNIISKFPSKPSLDRLDRTKGYTKDNTVLCCLAMNIGRNSSSKSVFEQYILKLKESGIDTSLWK